MTMQTLLSQQNISTDDNLLTHSALLRTIPLSPFVLFKKKQTKTSIQAGALSPVNIVTRRLETDNNVLFQVRDESSFHGLMLFAFQFELIRNVLQFLFQNLKSSIGNCFEILHFVVN